MKENLSIKPVVDSLEKLFDKANEKFYNGKLIRPVITFSPDEKKATYGHVTVAQVWKKGDETRHELNISCNCIESKEQVIGTMLHEMVHIYALQYGVKDTSRTGHYHNKKFQELANDHGLNIEKPMDKANGYTGHALSETGKAFAGEITDNLTELMRATLKKGGKKTRSVSYRYVCPICGNIARTTKEMTIICADCEEIMVLN